MFETRFFERPADEQELEHLHKRHTDVLDNIDATADEAKEVASDFRAQLKTLHEQEQNLRRNLKSHTIPVEVEAKAVANIDAGVMEYFDRDGNLIPQLTHDLSKADREQDALRKQLDMFQSGETGDEHKITSVTISTNTGQSVTLGEESVSDEQPVNGDIFTTSPSGSVISDIVDLVAVLGAQNPSDEQPVSFVGTYPNTDQGDELPFEFTDQKPDIRDGINGASAILTGNEKPLPKNSKKRTSEPEKV